MCMHPKLHRIKQRKNRIFMPRERMGFETKSKPARSLYLYGYKILQPMDFCCKILKQIGFVTDFCNLNNSDKIYRKNLWQTFVFTVHAVKLRFTQKPIQQYRMMLS